MDNDLGTLAALDARAAELAAAIAPAEAAVSRAAAWAAASEQRRAEAEALHGRAVADALVAGTAPPAPPVAITSARAADASAETALAAIKGRLDAARAAWSCAEAEATRAHMLHAAEARRAAIEADLLVIKAARARLHGWLHREALEWHVSRLQLPACDSRGRVHEVWAPLQRRLADAGHGSMSETAWHQMAPLVDPATL
jgi:hypothetical protein